jgi:hypothetical protein
MLDNIAFRKDLRRWVGTNESRQRQIRSLCSQDILFHINTFGYGEDPRLSMNGIQATPFVTWGDQDEAILTLWEAWGREDVELTKSRAQGGSYIGLFLGHASCVFRPNVHGIVVSWRKDFIDDKENPKALLPKVDKIHRMMPKWLVGKMLSTDMKRIFPDFGSSLTGETASHNVARAARPTFVIMDELGFWDPQSKAYDSWGACHMSTNSRIAIGTVQPYSKHADLRREQNIIHIVLDWKKCPTHSYMMYRAHPDGRIERLDTKHPIPDDYPFPRFDGRIRSPWYDEQCARAEWDMRLIARELDMEEDSAAEHYFSMKTLEEHVGLHARPPDYVGTFEANPKSGEPVIPLRFIEDPKGWVKLWGKYDRDENGNLRPPQNINFFHAADIGAGTGQSNSVISVGAADVGNITRKWAEIVRSDMDEVLFGRWGLAIAKWFNNAYAGWDAGGPCGRNYGRAFEAAGYPYVHYHSNETSKHELPGRKPGIWLNYNLKMLILGLYRDAIGRGVHPQGPESGAFINPSEDALLHRAECMAYVWGKDGKVHHAEAKASDASGAENVHGDRTIADSILNYIMDRNRVYVEEEDEYKPPPERSFAALLEEAAHNADMPESEIAFREFESFGNSEIDEDPFDCFYNFGEPHVVGGVK